MGSTVRFLWIHSKVCPCIKIELKFFMVLYGWYAPTISLLIKMLKQGSEVVCLIHDKRENFGKQQFWDVRILWVRPFNVFMGQLRDFYELRSERMFCSGHFTASPSFCSQEIWRNSTFQKKKKQKKERFGGILIYQ